MYRGLALLMAIFCAAVSAQDKPTRPDQATVKYIVQLHDAETGGFKADAESRPSLRATSGAVRALAKLGVKPPMAEKTARFVLACLDSRSGGFAEPGGEPDVLITSIGIMAACELGIDRSKFKSALVYLEKNARSFEEVRIAAAAVEAWGVADVPFQLEAWKKVAEQFRAGLGDSDALDGGARDRGSYVAFMIRLKLLPRDDPAVIASLAAEKKVLDAGQRRDGGWGKKGVADSDLETTYRVMRAYAMLQAAPKDPAAAANYLAAHRNPDGGYGIQPGGKSSLSGVYYAVSIDHFLNAK